MGNKPSRHGRAAANGLETIPSSESTGDTFNRPDIASSCGSEEGTTRCLEENTHDPETPSLAGTNTLGDGDTEIGRRRRGRKRAMPRDPFLTAVRCYLDDLRPYWQPLTVEQRRRDLKVIGRDLWTLRKSGRIANVRPSAINEDDIGALLLYWRTRPARISGREAGKAMDPSTQAHLFGILRKFLRWCGNPAIARIEARGHARFPRAIQKPIYVLSRDELQRLRQGADSLDGWEASVARFLVAFCPATGLRPKEIRLARLEDLDIARWRILVSHPKGEGSWAAPDYAPILPMCRQTTMDFLAERESYLGSDECDALIPYRRHGGDIGPWSGAMLRKLKARIEEASGIGFHLKTFRATFAQLAKDAGVSIEAVSRALRHKTTKTTEGFYARMRADDAFREFDRAFEADVVTVRQVRMG